MCFLFTSGHLFPPDKTSSSETRSHENTEPVTSTDFAIDLEDMAWCSGAETGNPWEVLQG